MTEENIKEVLASVKKGSLSVDDGLKKLKHLPFEDLGFARIDHHRTLRQGFPEVIFGRGKTVRQIQEFIVRRAREVDVAVIENENMDRAVAELMELVFTEVERVQVDQAE